MIDLLFRYGDEVVFVRIEGSSIQFGNSNRGAMLAPIQNIKLNYRGVIKEFPDLSGNPDWNAEAVKRFKKYVKSLKTEDKVCDYLIEEFMKMGYEPRYKQKAGHRPERIK